FGKDIVHGPVARIEQGVGLMLDLVDIAGWVIVGVIVDGIGLSERIVALAACAVSEIEGIRRPATLNRDRILDRVHPAERVVVVFGVRLRWVVRSDDLAEELLN